MQLCRMREVASYLGVSVFWDGNSSEGALCICCSAGNNMGVQINQANRITNQIQSALETIVSRCTDYEKRRDSIYGVFDKSAAQVIEDNLYMPEQDFVKLLVEYQGHLKLDASHTLKEKIS